jgi:hypothetical protein
MDTKKPRPPLGSRGYKFTTNQGVTCTRRNPRLGSPFDPLKLKVRYS